MDSFTTRVEQGHNPAPPPPPRAGRSSPLLLNQREAAAHLGLSVKRFRAICRTGNGPPVFAPDGGAPLFAQRQLDQWAMRDDRVIDGESVAS